MITLTPVTLPLPVPLPGARAVACRFSYDSAGLVGGVLEAPDATRLALPPEMSVAVPKRQAEYLAGRWCAAVALRGFGAGERVPTLPDRSPAWPDGYVGSITHAAGHAIAVVARDSDYRALGIDLEELVDDATAEQLAGMILRPGEWRHQPAGWSRARMLTVAFSAKEAFYKAVYPSVRRILEFSDVELLGADPDALTLTLRTEHRTAALPDESYRVAYRADATTCLTVVALPRTRTPGDANRWFLRASGPDAPARLFYFPFAGGNAAAMLPWQAHLGPGVELHVAQPPGRGARLFEEPPRDFDTLVAQLTATVADLADRPFALFGHSLGALVAFEVARALRRDGRPAPERLWVSGAEGPQTRLVKRRVSHLPDAELIHALADYGGTPAELLSDRDMMELVLPGVRADLALTEHYAYRPEPPLDLPIQVLRGDADPYVEAERATGWARETTRPLVTHVFPGDHFFLHPHAAAIAALVTAEFTGHPVPGRAP